MTTLRYPTHRVGRQAVYGLLGSVEANVLVTVHWVIRAAHPGSSLLSYSGTYWA